MQPQLFGQIHPRKIRGVFRGRLQSLATRQVQRPGAQVVRSKKADLFCLISADFYLFYNKNIHSKNKIPLEAHCPSNIPCRIKKKTIYQSLEISRNPHGSLEIPRTSPWFSLSQGSDACAAACDACACTGSTPRAHWTLVLRAGDHGQSSRWNDRPVTW